MLKASYDSETRVWSGPKVSPLYNPDQNLGELIVRVLEQTPDAVTQVSADTGVEVTCGEMSERILKIAVHLSELKLKLGDVVGVVAGNTEKLTPAVFACFLLGLPVNPLSPIMLERDIIQMFSKTKPKLIFCDGSNVEIVQNAVNTMKSEAKIYTVMEDVAGYESVTGILSRPCGSFAYQETDPNATVVIVCSSGSTGEPKAIVKSHTNLILECHPVSNYNPNGSNTLFQYSPIFWYSGLYFMIKGALYKYKRIVTTQSFSCESFIEIIGRFSVTHAFLPPFAIYKLLQFNDLRPLASIRSWMVGGSAVSESLCRKFERFIPNGVICVVYACTEQAILTTNKSSVKYGSSGTPLENRHLKIIDDSGSALDNGCRGEICVRSISEFQGYLNEPDKTQEAFDGEWFKTGDLGYFDDDGYVYILDRKKELLKYNGFQVTPSELETLINEIQGVVGSCVVGVPEENTGNDIIHAFVIADESMSGLSEGLVESYVSERVIDAKRLRGGVHFVKTFSVGLTGKVDRKQMRKQAQELSLTHCL